MVLPWTKNQKAWESSGGTVYQHPSPPPPPHFFFFSFSWLTESFHTRLKVLAGPVRVRTLRTFSCNKPINISPRTAHTETNAHILLEWRKPFIRPSLKPVKPTSPFPPFFIYVLFYLFFWGEGRREEGKERGNSQEAGGFKVFQLLPGRLSCSACDTRIAGSERTRWNPLITGWVFQRCGIPQITAERDSR